MGIHDKLYSEGAKLGFARGGKVSKVTDTGLMPASKGANQQEIEAGGHGKLKPGYEKGGKTKGRKVEVEVECMSKGGKAIKKGKGKKNLKLLDPNSVVREGEMKKASKKGMPKNVKAKGGGIKVHSSEPSVGRGSARGKKQ